MSSNDQVIQVSPGKDDPAFNLDLHQNVHKELNSIDSTLNLESLAPTDSLKIISDDIEEIMNEDQNIFNIHSIMDSIRGVDNQTPSKGFLKTFIGRLKMKYPGGKIRKA